MQDISPRNMSTACSRRGGGEGGREGRRGGREGGRGGRWGQEHAKLMYMP